ncbi:thioredoxin TrxC [Agrilutibacter solisilvae]|uniref:Thioredoxin n=1 Tax=Agrilutibacter solisilvae TaxID=2763317 RepID=A0A974XYD1_9GAMM|nr:thioredoxin TrxC [Lysobacter solisilvae]QSX78051.1 thioredoxin TrxC [Lysobacter solisilvae]
MNDAAILLPCPHCGAMNRLPRERLGQAPGCGKCHRALFTGQPIALSAASFERHAVQGQLPVVVDFWAPWCGPCLSMAPQFEAAARMLEPQVRLAKVDTEAEPALGGRFNIRSIPTLVLFSGGRELARQSGAMGSAQIVAWVRGHLG